jgi:hypothetical protein
MTQDDTFRILTRLPFKELRDEYQKWLLATTTFDENKNVTYQRFPVEDYGWTEREWDETTRIFYENKWKWEGLVEDE